MRVRGTAVAGAHRKIDSRRRPRVAALLAAGSLVAGLAVALPLLPADAAQASGDDVAAWSTGWSWTYQQAFNYDDGNGTNANIQENVTYTVAGTATYDSQSAYKVTLSGSITGGSGSAQGYKIDSFGGSVSGTEYVRRSDLALLQEDQTQHLTAKAHESFLSVGVTADVHLVLDPTPGWKTLAFPLNSGDSWGEHETIDYSGSFSYDASGLTSGGGPLNGSFDFNATAHSAAATVSVPIGSVATDAVTAHDSSGAQDDQWWSPKYHNLAQEHLAVPLDGAALTLDRHLSAASTPAPSTSVSETITPSLTCAGGSVTVSGKLSTGSAGTGVTVTLDESAASKGSTERVTTTTTSGGNYTATLSAPSASDGLGKNGARATWGVLVDAGGASADATLVVTNQDCTDLVLSADTSGPVGTNASASATLTDLATHKGVGNAQINFALSDGTTVHATTNSSGVATTKLPLNTPVRTATVTASYAGSSTLATSSDSSAIVISKDATTTTVLANPPSVTIGDPVTFTATVTPAVGSNPGGTVQFAVDGQNFGAPVAVSGNTATSAPLSSLALGDHTVTASYSGDDVFAASAADAVQFRVHVPLTPTTTTLAVSPSTSASGQAVALTATVASQSGSGNPTGAVTFFDGTTELGSVALSGAGTAELDVTDLAVGTHSITASYGGDDVYDASASAPSGQTVAKGATAVAVVAGNGSTVSGEPVSFTVNVSAVAPAAGEPAGSARLIVDGTPVGDPVELTGGVAVFPAVNTLTAGTHTIGATYSGDDAFNSSTGSTTQDVSTADTATTLDVAPSPTREDQDVTLTATVAAVAPGSGDPTGSVTFYDGGTAIGAGTLANGTDGVQATLTISTLAAGAHTLSARYAGDANYAASGSADVPLTVVAASAIAPTTTTLSSSANPSTYGMPITFTATVASSDSTAPTPEGAVQFAVDGVNIGDPVEVVDGTATSPVLYSPLSGDHLVTAAFQPGAAFGPSGDSLTQTVADAVADVALTSSASTSDYGQSVHFHAKVTSTATGTGVPTGSVQFRVDGKALGIATPLVDGAADSPAVSDLQPGTHTVTAVYSGDGGFLPKTVEISQTVNGIATTTTLASSANPSTFGQAVTFTATVTPSNSALDSPDGTVTFSDGTTVLGTAPVAMQTTTGTATLTVSSLAAGDHAVTATYSGSALFAASTSDPLTQSVSKAPTSIAAQPAVVKLVPLGLPIGTLRATLTSSNGPLTDQPLVFKVGNITACTATTDSNGVATCAAQKYLLNLILAGGYQVSYPGDANDQSSSARAGLLG